MGKGWLEKLMSFVGVTYEETEEDRAAVKAGDAGEGIEESRQARFSPFVGKKRPPLVSLPGHGQWKVMVIRPKSFDEVQTISDHLKGKKPVILNLESLQKDLAQRILLFMSGAIYALDGDMQKIGHGVFLFVPNNVGIHSSPGNSLVEKDGPSLWLKENLKR